MVREDVPLANEPDVELDDEVVEIEDEDVPLGVLEDEEDTGLVEIEDEETPLAANAGKGDGDGKGHRNWWWILLVIASAITGKKLYDKHAEKRKLAETNFKEVDDTEEK